MVVQKLVCS